MPAPESPVPSPQRSTPIQPATDEQIVRTFTTLTVAFAGALALVLGMGMFLIMPDGTVRARGAAIGVVLALVSWFGSAWITRRMLARATRHGTSDLNVAAAIGPVVFSAVAIAEVPALLGLVLALADGADVGPFVVAMPVAIVAIIVNASGPGAVRRHLERLRG